MKQLRNFFLIVLIIVPTSSLQAMEHETRTENKAKTPTQANVNEEAHLAEVRKQADILDAENNTVNYAQPTQPAKKTGWFSSFFSSPAKKVVEPKNNIDLSNLTPNGTLAIPDEEGSSFFFGEPNVIPDYFPETTKATPPTNNTITIDPTQQTLHKTAMTELMNNALSKQQAPYKKAMDDVLAQIKEQKNPKDNLIDLQKVLNTIDDKSETQSSRIAQFKAFITDTIKTIISKLKLSKKTQVVAQQEAETLANDAANQFNAALNTSTGITPSVFKTILDNLTAKLKRLTDYLFQLDQQEEKNPASTLNIDSNSVTNPLGAQSTKETNVQPLEKSMPLATATVSETLVTSPESQPVERQSSEETKNGNTEEMLARVLPKEDLVQVAATPRDEALHQIAKTFADFLNPKDIKPFKTYLDEFELQSKLLNPKNPSDAAIIAQIEAFKKAPLGDSMVFTATLIQQARDAINKLPTGKEIIANYNKTGKTHLTPEEVEIVKNAPAGTNIWTSKEEGSPFFIISNIIGHEQLDPIIDLLNNDPETKEMAPDKSQWTYNDMRLVDNIKLKNTTALNKQYAAAKKAAATNQPIQTISAQ